MCLASLTYFQGPSMFWHASVGHSFYSWVIFLCIDIPSFVPPFIQSWKLSCFCVLAIVDSAFLNFHISGFVWIPVYNSLGIGIELLGYIIILHSRWILDMGVHKVKKIQKGHGWIWEGMKICHPWGQASSDMVATEDKYKGEVGEDIRNLITKDFTDGKPWISTCREILW